MWPFKKKPAPSEKRYLCKVHGKVEGFHPEFGGFSVNYPCCEKCIGVMFVRASEKLEPIEEKK